MSNFKNKIQIFLLGLMLGLLVGGGFFILKLDDYFKELRFYKKLTERSISRQYDIEPATSKKKEERQNSSRRHNTIGLNHENSDAIPNQSQTDTLRLVSSKMDTSMLTENGEEIVVKKDELLSTKSLEVINISVPPKSAKDSLLQQVSGVREESKTAFKVEFWQSPINYKGYKLSHNKLVLYGINSTDPFSIFQVDGDLYLKHINNVYKLHYSNDFTQFEKVNDLALITKLNK